MKIEKSQVNPIVESQHLKNDLRNKEKGDQDFKGDKKSTSQETVSAESDLIEEDGSSRKKELELETQMKLIKLGIIKPKESK